MTSCYSVPQDYVVELLLERGSRGRGLLRDSITHPYHGLLFRRKGNNIFGMCKRIIMIICRNS